MTNAIGETVHAYAEVDSALPRRSPNMKREGNPNSPSSPARDLASRETFEVFEVGFDPKRDYLYEARQAAEKR